MNRPTLRLAAPLLAMNLFACTQVEIVEDPAAQNPELRQASVVSTGAPTFNPKPGDTVAWTNGITVHAPEGIEVDQSLLDLIKTNIDKEMTAKGYRFVEANAQPRYLVHGIMVLGNELNEKQLRDTLGFEPGLVVNDQNYEKGSLLLLLVNPYRQSTEWRAVVQVLTSTELTEEQNRMRMQYIVHSLLRPLPTLTPGAAR